MKNKFFIILFLGFSFLINAQDRTPSTPPSTITSSPVNTCIIPSCYPFQNLDLYQIFGAIKSNTSTSTGTITGSFYDNNSDTLNQRLLQSISALNQLHLDNNNIFSQINLIRGVNTLLSKKIDTSNTYWRNLLLKGSFDNANDTLNNRLYQSINWLNNIYTTNTAIKLVSTLSKQKLDTANTYWRKLLLNGVPITNQPSVTVLNPINTVTVANAVTSVTVANSPSVTVLNPVNTVTVANAVTSVTVANSPSVTVLNPVNTVTVANSPSVTVLNPVNTVTVANSPSVTVLNPVNTVTVANAVTSVTVANSPSVTVLNPVNTVTVANSPSVTVLNPVNTVTAINRPANMLAIAQSPVNTATSVTLNGVLGNYHYITNIEIILYYTKNNAGSATPISVATTNLYSNTFMFKTTALTGGSEQQIFEYATNNLKSQNVSFDTVISLPAIAYGIWKVTVNYYVAP